MGPNIFFGIINIASALVIIGISIPLVKHKIKMNHLYGIRIKKSFESEDSWYKINEYGGKQLILWSIPMIIAGFISFFVPFDNSNKDILALVLGVFPITASIMGAVIRIYAYAKKI
jgi:uncharacterized membrane protein